MRLRRFSRRAGVDRQDRRHRRRAPDRAADGGRAHEGARDRRSRYNDVPPEVYRSFGFPGADDLGNMFQFKRDFQADFCGARDPASPAPSIPRCKTLTRGWPETRAGSRLHKEGEVA